MDLGILKRPLTADEIDFRVQSVISGGKKAILLAYKDARADMTRLDEACSPLGWTREHSRDNANCTVSIYDETTKQWISKEDTGTESNTEAKKGLASDSFKRACFNWGIGRELYDYPLMMIDLNAAEQQDKKKIRPGDWTWTSSFSKEGVLLTLRAVDKRGAARYNYTRPGTGLTAKTTQTPVQPAKVKQEPMKSETKQPSTASCGEVATILAEIACNEDELSHNKYWATIPKKYQSEVKQAWIDKKKELTK